MISLITGISGMAGSILARQLLNKGHQVHGIVRRKATFGTKRIDDIIDKLTLHYGDMTDANSISEIVSKLKPDYLYHLACQSHVKISFEIPSYTVETLTQGTLNLLEAIRKYSPETRFYNAASSECFGEVLETPQSETTPFNPVSPYGCAKCFTIHITNNYRKAYGLFAANGILFNNESPYRSETFVTRKITRAATRIKLGLQDKIELGNIHAKRDWGYTPEYTEAMQLILDHHTPDNLVIATGKTHSVLEFLELVFKKLDLNVEDHLVINPKFMRPSEVDLLLGDPSKAKRILGWEAKTNLEGIVDIMVEHDLNLASIEKKTGIKISDY